MDSRIPDETNERLTKYLTNGLGHSVAVYEPQVARITNEKDIPSCSAIYRSGGAVPKMSDFRDTTVLTSLDDMSSEFDTSEIASLYDSFMHAVKHYGDAKFIGTRKGKTTDYSWLTYAETELITAKMGTALMDLLQYTNTSSSAYSSGVSEDSLEYDFEKHASVFQKTAVGIMGANSSEYMCAIQALSRQNFVGVPLYDTLGESAVEYILDHANVKLIFVSDKKALDLAQSLKSDGIIARTQGVVVWKTGLIDEDTAKEGITALKKTFGLVNDTAHKSSKFVMTFDDLVEYGAGCASYPVAPNKPGHYSISTLMYTSGTTGDPKGVVLSHANIIRMVAADLHFFARCGFEFVPYKDTFLSFLPLAHIYDRVIEETIIFRGCNIGYWRGEILSLTDDAKVLKPTLFAAVPRVLERMYTKINNELQKASFFKRAAVNAAYAYKLRQLQSGVSYRDASPFLDKMIFGKAKEALGGCVRAILSAGAPLPTHIEEFLKIFFCSAVVQGYGLTESSASAFMAAFDNWSMHGTVGVPTCALEFKLESVPDMNYDAYSGYYSSNELLETIVGGCTDLPEGVPAPYTPQTADAPFTRPVQGEVLLRGPVMFTKYYKNETLTAEVIDKDGWFHTGDIAELTPFRGLRIIDRKKNIFKLSQGEYIAVEKLEQVYSKLTELDQIWVYGNSFENYLLAVCVLNMPYVWATHVGPLLKQASNAKPTTDDERAAYNLVAASLADTKAIGALSFADVSKLPAYPTVFADIASSKWLKAIVLKGLSTTGRHNKLKGFEMIKDVLIEDAPTKTFSIENNLMTPTFKLKRPQLLTHYKPKIDLLYNDLRNINQ